MFPSFLSKSYVLLASIALVGCETGYQPQSLVLPGLAWDLVRAWLGQERKFSTTEQDTNSVIVEAAEATGGVAQGLDF